MVLEVVFKDDLMNESRFVGNACGIRFGIRLVQSQGPVEVGILFLNLVEFVHIRSFLQGARAIPERDFPVGVHRVEQVEDVRAHRSHTGATADEHHLVVRFAQEEFTVRSGNGHLVAGFAGEDERRADARVHRHETARGAVERRCGNTDVQHDDVAFRRRVCHGVSAVGGFGVVHFQIEHFHAFPVRLVAFVDVHVFEIHIQSGHVNLNVTA